MPFYTINHSYYDINCWKLVKRHLICNFVGNKLQFFLSNPLEDAIITTRQRRLTFAFVLFFIIIINDSIIY